MNPQGGQVAQYKDAIKLLKKKCQVAESQALETKSKYDSLETTVIEFLEYLTKPFSESNPQPDLTSAGLRCWWDVKKEGLFIEEKKNASLSSLPTTDADAASYQSRILELNADIQKLEFQIRDLEFNLERRNKDLKAAVGEKDKLRSELDSSAAQLESSTKRVSELETLVNTSRSQLTSLFISFSQYLDVNCEREEELKPVLYSTAQQIFPSSSLSDEQDSKNEMELMLLSTVDKVSLLKSRFHSNEEELAVKTSTITSQREQISNLIAVSDSDRETIAKLRQSLEKARTASAEVVATPERDTQVAELETANATLRSALQSLRENLEQQQKQVNASEARMVQLQKELVEVQQSSSEMVQQMHSASDERIATLTEENAQLHQLAEDSANEAAALHVLLEQATKQYDQELTVLRERKYAVEQQVTVSEKFLDNTNRAHREELSKLTISLQEAEKEIESLHIQLMEKDSEVRGAVENYNTLRSQMADQIRELTQQVSDMRAKMKEEKEAYEKEKRELRSSEQNLSAIIAEKVTQAQQKEKENAREQQRIFEEELVHVRKQVQILTNQLEEERKSNRKARDQMGRLSATISDQDHIIEQLRTEVTQKDSELLAGKQQINKLFDIVANRKDGSFVCCIKSIAVNIKYRILNHLLDALQRGFLGSMKLASRDVSNLIWFPL